MLRKIFKCVLCCSGGLAAVLCLFCFSLINGSSKTGVFAEPGYSVYLDDNHGKKNNKKSSLNGNNASNISFKTGNKGKIKNKRCLGIYNNNEKVLVLANKDHRLQEDYNPCLRYICNGRLQASEYLYDSLVEMLADADKQGYSYWIASAYRSPLKQQNLIDEDVNALMANGMSYEAALEEVYKETMPAGCSEHQTGLALDILCSGNTNMDVSQMEEPGNKWLRDNCYKYGFILRYPEDKCEITGINFEPWHFRYVGRQAAKYITKKHITLEEFYERIGNI